MKIIFFSANPFSLDREDRQRTESDTGGFIQVIGNALNWKGFSCVSLARKPMTADVLDPVLLPPVILHKSELPSTSKVGISQSELGADSEACGELEHKRSRSNRTALQTVWESFLEEASFILTACSNQWGHYTSDQLCLTFVLYDTSRSGIEAEGFSMCSGVSAWRSRPPTICSYVKISTAQAYDCLNA